MARIRTIKPEFWRSTQVSECSAMARLLFIGLWNFCDDGGRMPYSEKNIQMSIFPGDPITKEDVRRMIDELSSNEYGTPLVELYEIEGKRYLQVTGWEKHQRIDRPYYQFPDQNGVVPKAVGFTNRRTLDERSTPEGKGMEGKGMEGKGMEGKGMEGGSLTRTQRARASPPAEHLSKHDWPDDYRKQFADAYPHKVGMTKALEALERTRGKASWSVVMDGLRTYTETKPPDRQWANPKTWIEEERWNDRPAAPPAGNGRVRTDADVALDLARIAERQERERGQKDPQRAAVEIGGADLGGEHARDVSGTS